MKKSLHKLAAKVKHQVNTNRHLSWLKRFRYKGMWSLQNYSVAAGVAAGVFCAFIPLPLQMLCAGILAIIIRANILLAIAATWITNPITFIPINLFILKIGAVLTNTKPIQDIQLNQDIDWLHLSTSLGRIWDNISKIGYPLLVGSLVVAVIAATISFLLVYSLWYIKTKKRSRA